MHKIIKMNDNMRTARADLGANGRLEWSDAHALKSGVGQGHALIPQQCDTWVLSEAEERSTIAYEGE